MSTDNRIVHVVGGPLDGQTREIGYAKEEPMGVAVYVHRRAYTRGKRWTDEHGIAHVEAHYKDQQTSDDNKDVPSLDWAARSMSTQATRKPHIARAHGQWLVVGSFGSWHATTFEAACKVATDFGGYR